MLRARSLADADHAAVPEPLASHLELRLDQDDDVAVVGDQARQDAQDHAAAR